jgi:hypothetical protein
MSIEELSSEMDHLKDVLSKSSHSVEQFEESFIYSVVDHIGPEQWREEEVIISLVRMALDKQMPILMDTVLHRAQDLTDILDMALRQGRHEFLGRVIEKVETRQYKKWGEAMLHAAKGGLETVPQGKAASSSSSVNSGNGRSPPSKILKFVRLLESFFHNPTLPQNIETEKMLAILEALLNNPFTAALLSVWEIFRNPVLQLHFRKFSMNDWDRLLKTHPPTPLLKMVQSYSAEYSVSAIRNTQRVVQQAEQWIKVKKAHAPPSAKSYFESAFGAAVHQFPHRY